MEIFIGMYNTTQLIAVTQKKFKFQPFFLSLFFRETYTFSTEMVDLATIPGDVDMAVYISPTVEGKVLRTRGGLTRQFKPGYVKPKHIVWLSEVFVKLLVFTLNILIIKNKKLWRFHWIFLVIRPLQSPLYCNLYCFLGAKYVRREQTERQSA